MQTKRLLGAATAALMAGTLVGAAPVATANENGREDWTGKRVLKGADGLGSGVRLWTSQYRWALIARERARSVGEPETWKVRQSVNGGRTWGKPGVFADPGRVESLRAATQPNGDVNGGNITVAAWVENGRVYGAARADEPKFIDTHVKRLGYKIDLAAEQPGAGAPRVWVGSRYGNLVQYGDTWAHFRQAGGCTDCPGAGWVTYPAQDPTGVTSRAASPESIFYGFAPNGALVAVWEDPDTRQTLYSVRSLDTRPAVDAAWALPQVLADDGSQPVGLYQTAPGGRLVTQRPDGAVDVWNFDAASGSFGERREIGDPVTEGAVTDAQATVDGNGTLTVGFVEPTVTDGGLTLWQEPRPGGKYLARRPRLVPGTRGGDSEVVASPRGTLSVVTRRAGNPKVQVTHLPAGRRKWTEPIRLVSPKPTKATASLAVGMPYWQGNLRLVINDAAGIYGFEFDAPEPLTKMTRPRRWQYDDSYRVAWNTTWVLADTWQVRYRTERRRGGWTEWKKMEPTRGKSMFVSDVPRGPNRTRCYAARGHWVYSDWTDWSKPRCATVRWYAKP